MSDLDSSFFESEDVVGIARNMLGMKLHSKVDGRLVSSIITETEAYQGVTDKASHAYGGKRTARTETMFGDPGIWYVYLCYGIHSMLNVVTGPKDTPHAVLVRAVQIVDGSEIVRERRGVKFPKSALTNGPGKVCQALAINHRQHNGLTINDSQIWVSKGIEVPDHQVEIGPRIGIDYAQEDSKLPYRFVVKGAL